MTPIAVIVSSTLLAIGMCSVGEALHIVGISGSLRSASSNTGLLRAIQNQLPQQHTMTLIVPNSLPLFNEELEGPEVMPLAVVEFRKQLALADCFLFATTEYNFGLSGALKNALDWGSRGVGGNLYADKAAALVSSGGGLGGMRAQQHFRDCALFLNLHVMNGPQVNVNAFSQPRVFDKMTGDVVDEKLKGSLLKVASELVEWSRRLASPSCAATDVGI